MRLNKYGVKARNIVIERVQYPQLKVQSRQGVILLSGFLYVETLR